MAAPAHSAAGGGRSGAGATHAHLLEWWCSLCTRASLQHSGAHVPASMPHSHVLSLLARGYSPAEVKSAETVGPVLVHIVTEKGRGYLPAETAQDKMHGVVKFDPKTGQQYTVSARVHGRAGQTHGAGLCSARWMPDAPVGLALQWSRCHLQRLNNATVPVASNS